jgi:hypothetical protein
MRRLLVVTTLFLMATVGLTSVAGAAPMRFQEGQQWTLEIVTGPGQEGVCAIETVGPNNTLIFTAFGLINPGSYGGGRSFLRQSMTGGLSTYNFHGSWSNSLSEYAGRWKIRGSFEPGNYLGQIVPGAIAQWGNYTC